MSISYFVSLRSRQGTYSWMCCNATWYWGLSNEWILWWLERSCLLCVLLISKAWVSLLSDWARSLAIVFTVKLLHSNLYARVFKLRTDYKPLLRIFGENCGLPATAVSRLQRWSIILSGYDYIIEHLPGHEQEIAVINAVEHNAHDPVEDLPVSAADVAMVSKQDPDENRVIDYIAHGWPSLFDVLLQLYYCCRSELIIQVDCLSVVIEP